MDREKAIEYVKQAFDVWQSVFCTLDEDWGEETEALDLAIEALQREVDYGQMVVDYTKGEAVESGDWEYTNTPTNIPTDTPTNDCISRQQAIEAIEGMDWYHVNSKGKLVSGSTSDEESWYKAEDIYKALESLKPITPLGKVVAKIKVDTEELVERIKEECQLEQEHGRLIDVDKLLQELFDVDEEEWTTPEIRAILENAPTIITLTKRIGKWVGVVEYCKHLEEETRERYQPSGMRNTIYCNQCWSEATKKSDYCPNCGADMRLKDGEDGEDE